MQKESLLHIMNMKKDDTERIQIDGLSKENIFSAKVCFACGIIMLLGVGGGIFYNWLINL